MKKTLVSIVSVCMLAIACSKDDSASSNNANASLLVGKWKEDSVIYQTIDCRTTPVTEGSKRKGNSPPQSYLQFTSDGKAIYEFLDTSINQIQRDTTFYTISNKNFSYYGDSYEVLNLTANKFQIYGTTDTMKDANNKILQYSKIWEYYSK